ncbi:MAG: RpiB/LacA/LacB family sugar-phosphate isomerase [Nitrososphaerota archaeon]|nr:RpiB/LacA/LacB family sugar-phosphate isomerase [Candidatus Calditenuaceae archaeon]MDW8073509.1 RpiB/LacA/LacB family sugar-phosphate isomerase [Nitrososphaerota archaeon]
MQKRVVVGSDDKYPAAVEAARYLVERGFEVVEVGALKSGRIEPWPDVAFEVGKMVAEGKADWGVVVCYTGTGVSIAANKVKGVRAALCVDAQTARGAKLWNDANVLAMSGRLTTPEIAREIIDSWLNVEKIDETEKANIERLKKADS